MFIDTHTHLYLEEFKDDIHEVINQAKSNGVQRFYLPSTFSGVIENMMALEEKYSDSCFAMMGLHPCYVKENVEDELIIVEEWLKKRKFVAVGEIGLDFYWDKTFTENQYNAFDKQMQWALDLRLPIVIHSRNAMQETLERMLPFTQKGLKGIFHCFSGTASDAQKIVEMNFLLGIGGVVTYKNAGVAEAIKDIPLDFLVLETDAPYLSPNPYRGKRNESKYLIEIAQKIADVKNTTIEVVASATTENALKLFGQ